jgi:hypothetical protein
LEKDPDNTTRIIGGFLMDANDANRIGKKNILIVETLFLEINMVLSFLLARYGTQGKQRDESIQHHETFWMKDNQEFPFYQRSKCFLLSPAFSTHFDLTLSFSFLFSLPTLAWPSNVPGSDKLPEHAHPTLFRYMEVKGFILFFIFFF